jgi:hypothetical protein
MPRPCAPWCARMLDGLVYVMGIEVHSVDVFRYDPVSEVWSSVAPTLT